MDLREYMSFHKKGKCNLCSVRLNKKRCRCGKQHGIPSRQYPHKFCRGCIRDNLWILKLSGEDKEAFERNSVMTILERAN